MSNSIDGVQPIVDQSETNLPSATSENLASADAVSSAADTIQALRAGLTNDRNQGISNVGGAALFGRSGNRNALGSSPFRQDTRNQLAVTPNQSIGSGLRNSLAVTPNQSINSGLRNALAVTPRSNDTRNASGSGGILSHGRVGSSGSTGVSLRSGSGLGSVGVYGASRRVGDLGSSDVFGASRRIGDQGSSTIFGGQRRDGLLD